VTASGLARWLTERTALSLGAARPVLRRDYLLPFPAPGSSSHGEESLIHIDVTSPAEVFRGPPLLNSR
jgi:hypothetical protein